VNSKDETGLVFLFVCEGQGCGSAIVFVIVGIGLTSSSESTAFTNFGRDHGKGRPERHGPGYADKGYQCCGYCDAAGEEGQEHTGCEDEVAD